MNVRLNVQTQTSRYQARPKTTKPKNRPNLYVERKISVASCWNELTSEKGRHNFTYYAL